MNIFTKTTLFLLLLGLAGSLFPQNWAPMRLGERYNYQQDSAGVITQTLWLDSVTVQNGDSLWYSNMTYAAVKDTFQGRPDEHIIFDSPFFLQKTVRKVAPSHFELRDTALFDLQLFRGVGDSWVFDARYEDTAVVVAVADSMLWGTAQDSVKYIQLSAGGTIIASKHHGILEWDVLGRQMLLVGMQGNTVLGEQVPMFDDFYGDAFQVGDEMEWASFNLYQTLETTSNLFLYKQRDASNPDSLKIVFDSNTRNDSPSPDDPSFYFLQNVKETIIDSVDHPANAWPGQMAPSYPFADFSSSFGSQLIAPVVLYKTAEGKYYKNIGTVKNALIRPVPRMENHSRYFPLADKSFINEGDSLFRHRDYLQYSHSYFEGVGFYSWNGAGFEFSRLGYCTGYVHQGDTIIGSLSPERFWWATSIEDISTGISLQAFPNPASSTFEVRFEASNQPAQLQLIDLAGKLLTTWELSSQQSTHTLSIPASVKSGMYVLQMQRGSERGVFRFMVKK